MDYVTLHFQVIIDLKRKTITQKNYWSDDRGPVIKLKVVAEESNPLATTFSLFRSRICKGNGFSQAIAN